MKGESPDPATVCKLLQCTQHGSWPTTGASIANRSYRQVTNHRPCWYSQSALGLQITVVERPAQELHPLIVKLREATGPATANVEHALSECGSSTSIGRARLPPVILRIGTTMYYMCTCWCAPSTQCLGVRRLGHNPVCRYP